MFTRKFIPLIASAAALIATPSFATTPKQYCQSIGGACEILDISNLAGVHRRGDSTGARGTGAFLGALHTGMLIKYCKNNELRYLPVNVFLNDGVNLVQYMKHTSGGASTYQSLLYKRAAYSHGTTHDHLSDATICSNLP